MEEALLKESSIGQKIESSNYTCDGWEEDESSLHLNFFSKNPPAPSNLNTCKNHTIVSSTLDEELTEDIFHLITTKLEDHEKNTSCNEMLAKMMKLELDHIFGSTWQVVIGSSFSLSVDCEQLVQILAGEITVIVWKSDSVVISRTERH